MKLVAACAAALLAVQTSAAAISHKLNGFTITEHPDPEKRALLQNYVTWDSQSLFVKGERIMIFSGEFHPFRLPVPTLWKDVFQKVKALGFNCVSFYVDWALLEGKPGEYRAEGVFALEPFFEAAKESGIYLLARPGPYINAEASGGGFPGWLQRVNATLRTAEEPYLKATDNYMANTVGTIAKAQITNGGPVILIQPENEYSGTCCGLSLNGEYMQYVEDQIRNAGMVVPLINNDAWAGGHNAPGTGPGSVDIYGHDSYPLGFDCANPTVWPTNGLPTYFRSTHEQQSPSTPYSLVEFQGGSFDPWGGPGFAKCAELTNNEFERVFYKNDFSFGVAIMNLYMIFGGTNWGNLGHPGGYTSYDYGSSITESRNITRTKYSELKLLGNFAKVSESYLVATPGTLSTGVYTDTAELTTTPLTGNNSASYYVVRHSDYTSQSSTNYKLKVPTSAGNVTVPQLGGQLTLNGRDSKIHVVDYDVAGTNVLYSSAEVFTWKKFEDGKVLVLYGGNGEHHEFAVSSAHEANVVEGCSSGITKKQVGNSMVVAWDVSSERCIVQVEDMKVLLLRREDAFNYWVPQLSTDGQSIGFSTQETTASSIIVQAGYLVRTAYMQGHDLHIDADFNATTPVEVIGVPQGAHNLYINGNQVSHTVDRNGFWSTNVNYKAPELQLPSLKTLEWKYVDSLPEIQPSYDDSAWPAANLAKTYNTHSTLQTPTSLYGSDYGFNTGSLIFRGHFVATGAEQVFSIITQGGSAFGSSVWLNQTYLGSWPGIAAKSNYNSTYQLPNLKAGMPYVFTVLIDNMGLDEDWTVGTEQMKNPRGILNYQLVGRPQSAITWKLTGNLGGEDYLDKVRGPLNEGALYAERQGYHQPQPPTATWKSSSPLDGLSNAGVGYYTAEFDLNIPAGWDVPLFFNFGNSTNPPPNYRAQLFVNGYQFGKYVNNIGPESSYPVPEGILNYRGTNWVGLTLWSMEADGVKLDDFELAYATPVMTSLTGVESVEQPQWTQRAGAY